MNETSGQLDVTVVGAGPAGLLTALCLARRGHRVEVHERRGDPRVCSGESGRSMNFALSARGERALRRVGVLDDVLELSVPMRGRMVHDRDGSLTLHPYRFGRGGVSHSLRRDELTALLVEAASTAPNIRFTFGSKLVTLDVDTGVLWFVDTATGVETSSKADLVVGADGCHSRVRAQLLHGGRADYHQEFMDWGYRELRIPPGPCARTRADLEALHLWSADQALMVGSPNRDGSITGTLFLPHGPAGFDGLTTPETVLAFFDRTFPDLRGLVPDLAEQFLARPVGDMVTVRTTRWVHQDRVVLVGDACHAVWPFYAQGMNAALEDCVVLDDCLAAHPSDRAAALAAYERRRQPDTDVLAELTRQNFHELRDGMRSPLFVAKKRVDLLLQRLLPGRWAPLYTMVAHTTMPYSAAVRRAQRQDAVLGSTATAVAVVAGLAALVAALRSRRPDRRPARPSARRPTRDVR